MTDKLHSHASKLRLINDHYSRLHAALSHCTDFGNLLEAIETEERRHRRMGRTFGRTYARGLTVDNALRLFAVQQLLQCRTGQRKEPRAADVAHLNRSVFLSWALWANNRAAIRKAIPLKKARAFLETIDYASLIAGPSGNR